MKTKICTDVEQSKKLIELGIDLDTSDMYWDFQIDGYVLISYELGYYHNDSEIPAWSLSALLNLLPLSTTLDHEINGWYCNINYDIVNIKEGYKDYTIICDNPIDAAFEMICWIRKNNKL